MLPALQIGLTLQFFCSNQMLIHNIVQSFWKVSHLNLLNESIFDVIQISCSFNQKNSIESRYWVHWSLQILSMCLYLSQLGGWVS